jgi:hypothetical protein
LVMVQGRQQTTHSHGSMTRRANEVGQQRVQTTFHMQGKQPQELLVTAALELTEMGFSYRSGQLLAEITRSWPITGNLLDPLLASSLHAN